MKLETFNSSYFMVIYFVCDGFRNNIVYQPTFNTLDLNKDKGTNYVIDWTPKCLFESKLLPFMMLFLPHIKCFEYAIGIQFSNTFLVV